MTVIGKLVLRCTAVLRAYSLLAILLLTDSAVPVFMSKLVLNRLGMLNYLDKLRVTELGMEVHRAALKFCENFVSVFVTFFHGYLIKEERDHLINGA